MRKEIPNGLYKKLAAYSVVMAFTFGLIISVYQIYRDYVQQESRLIADINDRVQLVQASAEKAIYEFDENLAQLVVDGIGEHPAVLSLKVYDDYNDLFKSKVIQTSAPRSQWWPNSWVLAPRTLIYPLQVQAETVKSNARIEVMVDPFLVVDDFIERSLLIVLFGLLRNVLLAIVLLFLCYRLVTRAILGLSQDLSKIDPMNDQGQLITIPTKHQKNELGYLASMINDLLQKIRQGMRQINDLNSELNQQLLDKSQIEKALNLAGERTAERTGQAYIHSMVEFIADTMKVDGVSLFRRTTQGGELVYEPVVSLLNGKKITQKQLLLNDLPLDLLSGHHAIAPLEISDSYQEGVFQTFYGMTIPIRNSRQNIVNLLQLVSASPISDDFYQQNKSLLQILSSRFVTESERERQERKILEVAHTDSLTKLSNRYHFQSLLKEEIETAKQRQEKVVLIHVDVNNFKWINDSFSYELGDQLLIQMAQRLSRLVSEDSLVARVAGDEFVIIKRLNKTGIESLLSEHIHSACQKTFVIDNHVINPKVSVGMVIYPDHAQSSEDLIKHAEYAVNMAKRKKGVRTQYFNQDVAAEIERKHVITKSLDNAIDLSLLTINLQPICCVKTGEINSYEVLCRWDDAELGRVSPDEFIPVAEETGLVHKLGSWVLEETIKTMKLYARKFPDDSMLKVAVNFSAHQLMNPSLVDQYLNTIKQAAIDPSLITFEITESMLIDDLAQGSEILENIAGFGCEISIDDFGTGYSSLQYLKHLPINNLKIDKEFINGISGDGSDISIVKAIISLARALQMNVIAEGVETEEQKHLLSQLSCDMMQGYYFSKPLTISQVLENKSQQASSLPQEMRS